MPSQTSPNEDAINYSGHVERSRYPHSAEARHLQRLDQSVGHGVQLIPRGRLPEFDAIALRVDDPAEAAVFEFFDTIVDLHALLPQLSEESVRESLRARKNPPNLLHDPH